MTTAAAVATIDPQAFAWNAATPVLDFVGFLAVLLLSLALVGLVGRW